MVPFIWMTVNLQVTSVPATCHRSSDNEQMLSCCCWLPVLSYVFHSLARHHTPRPFPAPRQGLPSAAQFHLYSLPSLLYPNVEQPFAISFAPAAGLCLWSPWQRGSRLYCEQQALKSNNKMAKTDIECCCVVLCNHAFSMRSSK